MDAKEGNFVLPAKWTDFQGNQKVVVLPPTDGDYQTLEATFLQSAGSGFTITKTQYQTQKKKLDYQNPKGTICERLLWHGTSSDVVDNININGLNKRYCGKNGTALGEGVYFAVNANYSACDTYSRRDPAGVKRIYYCRVLTGVFTQGKSGMKVAPMKNGYNSAVYDSVVDTLTNPVMT